MTKNNTIKEKLSELDELVTWFEQEDIEIDQALAKFEEAVKLADDIGKELKTAKNKIEVIKKKFDV
ncbi:exodeoxyribonuclease VII small subunit [Candidatus Saccharibacteria bacterium RIFCSPHIGHO2_12_FULL_42_8]|nr:MAG: exodeoxyribonuclease VII small subunit [Candidatus Saccharibacteria bacterium RIFCSPHIGHO2_12_FULL_42_8]